MTEQEYQIYMKSCNDICMKQHLISNYWKPLLVHLILQLILLWISDYLNLWILIPLSFVIFISCIIGWSIYIKRRYKSKEI